MKIGDVITLDALGKQPHKVVAIESDGRICLETYLWPYEMEFTDAEKAKRHAVYDGGK